MSGAKKVKGSVSPNSKYNYLDAPDCSRSDILKWSKGFIKSQRAKKESKDGMGQCYICKVECSTRCKGCKNAPDGRFSPFYCGKEHQLSHWKNGHKKGCSPWTPLMGLLFAVQKNTLPGIGGPDYNDYGFGNCKTMDEEKNLLGLYIGLIERVKCDLDELHEACVNGVLDQFIIKEYEGIRDRVQGNMGGYYPWFLENQHVVQNIVVTKFLKK